MEIRRAHTGDIAHIAKIEHECFPDAWSETALSSHLRSQSSDTLVAVRGEELLAYLLVGGVAPECEIYRIATDPCHRRKGLGRKLLSALFEAKGEGTRYFLEVRESNAPAIALYRSVGFTPCGIRKGYYRLPTENAVVMNKF